MRATIVHSFVLLAAAGCTSAASGQVYQDVVVGGGAPYIIVSDGTLRGSPLSRTQSWTNNAWEHTGSASASAWAQYGVLRASAHAVNATPSTWDPNANIPNALYPYGAVATASASFTDTITINAANPLLQGTAGSFTASMDFNGTWSAGFLGSAVTLDQDDESPPNVGAYLQVSVGGSYVLNEDSSMGPIPNGDEPWTTSGGASGLRTFTVNFIFGQSFQLYANLSVFASMASGNIMTAQSVYGHSDFGNSATWNGISQVVTSGGTVLGSGDYSMSSTSGADYTNAIPTPSAAAVGGLGLGGLASLRRRR